MCARVRGDVLACAHALCVCARASACENVRARARTCERVRERASACEYVRACVRVRARVCECGPRLEREDADEELMQRCLTVLVAPNPLGEQRLEAVKALR
eukprot:1494133-Pleurochrysis_carterae.AAC.1